MPVLYANSVDPGKTPRAVASGMGLHCLPLFLLWHASYKWVSVAEWLLRLTAGLNAAGSSPAQIINWKFSLSSSSEGRLKGSEMRGLGPAFHMLKRKGTVCSNPIVKTYLYDFDPLKPDFYIVKFGFTGYTLFFLFLRKNIDCGYSLEPPRRVRSNEYPLSMFWAETWKISVFIWNFHFFFFFFFFFFLSWNFLYMWIGITVLVRACVRPWVYAHACVRWKLSIWHIFKGPHLLSKRLLLECHCYK